MNNSRSTREIPDSATVIGQMVAIDSAAAQRHSIDITIAAQTHSIVTTILRDICTAPNSNTIKQDDSCTICLEPFGTSREEPMRLPCGHVFGLSCLVTWTKAKVFRQCPMCRVQYLDPTKSLEFCKRHCNSAAISRMIDRLILKVRQITDSETLARVDDSASKFYDIIWSATKPGRRRRSNRARMEILLGIIAWADWD